MPVATQLPDIRLNRDPMRTFIRQWVKFEARGKDGAQPRVAWFVQEGEDGGTIAADGTYTPPAQPGLFHVTAVRVDDPTLAGSIPVQVVTAQELYDYGGPILPAPKVQLVWWGTTDDFQGAVDLFHGFLAGVNGSDWLAVLDQYLRGAKAQVSVAGEIFEPAQSGGTARAQSQLCAVLESHRMAPDPTTIYSLMVASSSGNFAHHATTVCQGVRVPIIVLSLPPQDAVAAGGCQGTMTPAEDMLRAFSHELAETMTDPTASMAWADIFGQEVADVCASPICAALPTGRFPLNALLSNSTHGCAP
jgi:hypothetical protein